MGRQQNLTLAGLLLFFLFTQKVQSQDTLQMLLKNSIEIKSIDPMNEDFTDLMPLIEKIGKAKVVVLGEISHSDGASSAFKSRMVKFLHQKMGFDVLEWEAGELDCYNLNTALRSNMRLADAKKRLMKGGWDSEEAIHPLFEYARASWNTERPLEMAGFDNNRPPYGIPGFLELLRKVYTVFPFLKPAIDTANNIDSLVNLTYGYFKSINLDSAFKPERRQNAISSLHKTAKWLEQHSEEVEKFYSKKEAALIVHFIQTFIPHWTAMQAILRDHDNITWNRIRDSAMDASLAWQMEHLYPGRKIIIWAASAHFTRNTDLKRVPGFENMRSSYKQAGDYLYSRLGKDMYTIACTTAKGEIGQQYASFDDRNGGNFSFREKVPQISENSYESWAVKAKKRYLFTDLRKADGWLQGDFLSTCLGFTKTTAPWSKIIDALFFIETMSPVRMLIKDH
jgi:erythromycin esterase